MTQRTKAELATQISTLLADNTSGDISESDVRSVFTDTKDSLVGGPASATDNTLVRFDSTTGQLVQATSIVVADTTMAVSGVGMLTVNDDAGMQTTTTTTDKFTLGAYDVNGAAYVAFATLTAADTPLCAFTQPAGSTLTWDGGAIGSVTPASGAFTTLSATGAVTAGTYVVRSVGNALTAAGTTRADALQLAKEINNVTTAAAGTGVILPVGVVGMRISLFNAGANAIKVYASASETVDTVAGATGVPLSAAARADFFFTAADTWVSALMGAVSA